MLPANFFCYCCKDQVVSDVVPHLDGTEQSPLDDYYCTSRSLSLADESNNVQSDSDQYDSDTSQGREYVRKLRAAARAQKRRNKESVYIPRANRLELQSTETDTSATSEATVAAQNLVFRDGSLSTRLEMGAKMDSSYAIDEDATADLGQFLSRPVKITTITWPESTFTQTAFQPWALFFNAAQIKKKLDNYARLHCTLKLKFVINASPFYFGSLRACYFPLGDARSNYVNAVDQLPFSQVPGVYLEPQNMSTAEMELPFLWPNTWLNVAEFDEFAGMGVLSLLQYANLRSANGVSGTGITVAVYAWAENVTLAAPTTALALQSDEYDVEDGVVSGPATAVANVASKLTDVPVIGEFANATAIGARAVAGIAKLFGYSNPPVIEDVKPYQPKAFHAFANVETRVPIDKLAVDPKNEVTISSSVAGVDEPDPLAFQHLLTHESFLQGTLWSNANAVDTLLWSACVTPGYYASGGGYRTYTPVSYFSKMFRFWRGSIIYKFRFIKTKYHKGRVLISWDPQVDITSTADTETTTFSRVVDLEVEDEVEITIPFKAVRPFLDTIETANYSNGAAPSYTYAAASMNGVLTMRVQNILTGPAASPQIDVLVYTRAGDDFMLAAPQELNNATYVRDPAGVIQSEEESMDQKPHDPDQTAAQITTGELFSSLRPLLHRSCFYTQQPVGSPIAGSVGLVNSTNCVWRVPYGCGRMNTGYAQATISGSTVPFNFAKNHPIDYVLNCFVGYRGSTVLHANVITGPNIPKINGLSANRFYSDPIIASGTNYRNGATTTTSPLAPSDIARSAVRAPSGSFYTVAGGLSGMSLTNTDTQTALSVCIPQYSRYRFQVAFSPNRNIDPVTNTQFFDEVQINTQFYNLVTPSSTTDWPVISYYYAAGVDFQPVFFLCTPRQFLSALPSAVS